MPIYERQMPGLELYRFRMTLSGWKLDGVLSWGCGRTEYDDAFLKRLWSLPGW